MAPFVVDSFAGTEESLFANGVIICSDESAFILNRLLLLEFDVGLELAYRDGAPDIEAIDDEWAVEDCDADDAASARSGSCSWDCDGEEDEDDIEEVCGSPTSKLAALATLIRASALVLAPLEACPAAFFFRPLLDLG